MNVSALYGIRWIAKSTSDSFGLGVGSNPDVDHIYADILCAAGADVCGTGNSISYRWRSE